MKLFLDTANVEEIRKALDTGVLDGVTTNPSIIAKTGKPFETVAREILEMVPGDVSLEAMSDRWQDMIPEVERMAGWGRNAVIKLPMTRDGIKALSILSREGIRVNLTMVASQNQALLACKAGAAYVSLIVGRMDAIGIDGMQVVRETREMIREYGFGSQIIIGSVRSPLHVLKALQAGTHVVTMSCAIFDQLFDHPLSEAGIQQFKKDWQSVDARRA